MYFLYGATLVVALLELCLKAVFARRVAFASFGAHKGRTLHFFATELLQ